MTDRQRPSGDNEPGAAGVGIEHPRLSPVLTAEMSRLYSAGYSLIPLGGSDGKKPTVKFRDRPRFPLSAVVNRMANGGGSTYGIRLDGLLVIDVDTDTSEARAYVEQHFGSSPARTRTSRGFHLFYRFGGLKPKSIRLPGIAIDFKSGANEFVVGPQSERAGGIVYWPEGRLTRLGDLPWFKDLRSFAECEAATVGSGRVPVGSRNDALKRRAGELLPRVRSLDELSLELRTYRDASFEEPGNLSDSQVSAVAAWFWDLRQSGRWWGGRNAVVNVNRQTALRLVADRHHLALSLLMFLTAMHGAEPAAVFAIDPRALKRAGHFRDGVNQLYAAISVLLEQECLVLTRPARGKRAHHEYRFGSGVWEKREGGASSYIDVQIGDPNDQRAA